MEGMGKPEHDDLRRRLAELEAENARQRRELDEQTAFFGAVLSAVRDCVYVFDAEGRFVFANQVLLDLWGLDQAQAIGKTMRELDYPKEVERQLTADVRQVLATGEAVRSVTRYSSPAGATGYYDNILAPIRDEQGAITLVAGSSRDITDARHAEARLRQLAAEAERRAGQLDAMFAAVAEPLLACDGLGRVVKMNAAAEAELGAEAQGRTLAELVVLRNMRHLDGRPIGVDALPRRREARGRATVREQVVFRDASGAERVALVSLGTFADEPAGVGLVTVWHDLSGSQPALAEIESLARFPEENPHPILRCAPDGTIVYTNKSARPLLDAWAAALGEILPPPLIEPLRAALASGQVQECEVEAGGRDFAFSLVPVAGAGYVNLYGRDITTRRQSEREREQLLARIATLAAEAERRAAELDAVFSAMADTVVVYDTEGGIARMNEEGWRLTGYTAPEAAGSIEDRTRRLRLVRPDGSSYRAEETPTTRALHGEVVRGELMGLETGAGRTWVLASAAPVRAGDGAIVGAVATLANVTDLRRAQEMLREQGERLAITLRSIADGVIVTDAALRVILMNPAAEAMTGWGETEAIGQPAADVYRTHNERTGASLAFALRAALTQRRVQALPADAVLASRDGSRRFITDTVAPIAAADGRPQGLVVVFGDVSERRFLQDERAKVNRLESVGVLAGGIAHDFNNLLTGILGNVTLARMEAAGRPQLEALLLEAERAGERAAGLTQQLLTFARGGQPVKRVVSLAELLPDTAGFAVRGGRATARFRLAPDLWQVEADPGQLSQVIQNLVINAREAMPEGGTVTVSADNVVIGEADLLPLPPGDYVRVTIADEGIGIPTDVISRVFDPYYTTKASGSGLGLAVVYSVVVKHEGHVTVESEVGRGSRFHVYLPATHGAAAGVTERPTRPRGKGRILVMEGEEVVRRVARRMLERLGYEVETAEDGEAAVALYEHAREAGLPFSAVILDLYSSGGSSGRETLERLRQVDPEVRAFVSSGHPADPVMVHHTHFGFAGAIEKPFSFEQLTAALAAPAP